MKILALAAIAALAGPAAAAGVETGCEVYPVRYSLCDVTRRARSCPSTGWSEVAVQLEMLARVDPGIPLNLAKAGVGVRLDFADPSLKAAAEYGYQEKAVHLPFNGGHAVHELAHAIDDVLKPNSAFSAARALFSDDPKPLVTTWQRRLLHTRRAARYWSEDDPELMGVFSETLSRPVDVWLPVAWRAEPHQNPIETFAMSVEALLDPDPLVGETFRNRHPRAAERATTALRLFAEIDEWSLLDARLEQESVISPEQQQRLRADFEWERHQENRPQTLAQYCAASR